MKKRIVAALAVVTLALVPTAVALASYTWTDVSGSTEYWYSMAVSDAGLIAYSSQHRLTTPFDGHFWKTIDGGSSWTELTSSPSRANWRFVSTSGDGEVVAGVGYATDTALFADITISRDGGVTWSTANAESNRQWSALAMSRNGNVLVATARNTDGTNGAVMKTTNGGTSWSDITPDMGSGRLHGGGWAGVAMSSDGGTIVAALVGAGLYTSTDGGATWVQTLVATSGVWPSISSSGDGRYFVGTNDFYSSPSNGVWVSADYGMSWTKTYAGAGGTPTAVSRDGSTMAFAKTGEKLYVSRDHGATWVAEPPANSSWSALGLNESGERLIAVAENGLARFATSTTTTTTTTTTSTTIAPTTTASPTTTVAQTVAASTTTAASTTSTLVDSPVPAVTPSMVESFAPKYLVKESSVAPGSTVTVRIGGFQPYELVSIGFDDSGTVRSQGVTEGIGVFMTRNTLVTVRADATGTISVAVKTPVASSGAVTLWAYGRESHRGFRQKLSVAGLPSTGSNHLQNELTLVASLALAGLGLVGVRRRLRGLGRD